MSTFDHLPYPPDFDRDPTAAHHEERRRRALRRLDVGDVLSVVDDLIASEPNETQHPFYDMARFLLDEIPAVDGGKLYDRIRSLVNQAVQGCLQDALDEMEE